MKIFLRGILMMTTVLFSVQAAAFDHAYSGYGRLLQKHVHWLANGQASTVDYAALKSERTALAGELRLYSAVGKAEFEGWSRDQQMAFLINAYNAWTLELILTKYPGLKSIRDLGSLLASPWKKSFFPLWGETRSLDWLEHQQLRPRYRDPRVHFAVNCASIGCPALRPEPYLATSLNAQLNDQQRRFLSDRSRNRFNVANGTLNLSSIFKWYGEDFAAQGKGLEGWLATQAQSLADNPADQARIASSNFKVEYQSYDWHLNDSRKVR